MKKELSEEEALAYCFQKLRRKIIGRDDYERLRHYKRRYEEGKLKQNGLETLLSYFGFVNHTHYSYHPDKDNSL